MTNDPYVRMWMTSMRFQRTIFLMSFGILFDPLIPLYFYEAANAIVSDKIKN